MCVPWIICGLCFVAFVGVAICLGLQCEQEKNNIAEQHIKRGNKVFCRFTIEDKQTGELLIYGEKYKGNLNKLVFTGTFKEGVRTIFVYKIDIAINGVDCTLTFYANSPECEPYTIIAPEGEKLFSNDENTL